MKTVLVIDSDLGFVFWLGRGLDQAGYPSFPAKSVPNAKTLLNELKIAVDLGMLQGITMTWDYLVEYVQELQAK